MKMFTNRLRPAAILAGVILAGWSPQSPAQTKPVHREEIASLDLRGPAVKSPERLAERNAGLNALKGQLPDAKVAFDPLLDSPRFIYSTKGFLTGVNGEGRAVSPATAQAFAENDPYRSVKAFLTEHAELFGHGAEALSDAAIVRDATGTQNGLRSTVWQQRYAGIPVFGAKLVAHVTAKGELVSLGSHFLPNLDVAVGGVNPASVGISIEQGLVGALGSLGKTVAVGAISKVGVAGDGYDKFSIQGTSAHGRLAWLPMNRGNLRLAWELYVTHPVDREGFLFLVDAQSGAILRRQNLTQYISDATYNVYTGESPSPFSPGWPTPNAGQPPLTNRTLVTFPALDVTASPNGWIDDGVNETRGNNTDTFLDRDFDGAPDGGTRPQGNPNRVFDFPLDLTLDPIEYTNAAVVQMFYKVNYYHDLLYQLGFDEASGNFQRDNFGRGGLGGDEIISYVQAAADLGARNNAFFVPAPDGINGQIAMFLWSGPNPDRDGDLDAHIIYHEATHGTSWRLVGGGFALGNLQGDGMGEGWSDLYSLGLTVDPNADPDAVYPSGGYATYLFAGLNVNYYFGVRRYPYSTDLNKNPLTFKDIDPAQALPHAGVPLNPIYAPFDPTFADEVHFQGEVWCAALWEVRANLIRKYGSAGNDLMMRLVTDGMKLTPAQPNFLEARDAILMADRVNNSGANTPEIWAGFAKRGMGVSATSPPGDTTAGIVEAYDVPGLQIDEVILSGGNGNGAIDLNECDLLDIILKNNSLVPATGISVRLATTNRAVGFGSKVSNYLDIGVGELGTNQIPFTISTSPSFLCGTPITVYVTIKSDQVTSTSTLIFKTGTNGPPARFDNLSPIAIPDGDNRGTNSSIVVSNITSAISKLTVSLYLTHTYDSDLTLQLISPEGITNTLSANNGGSANNYGAACAPDTLRTTFDDDAAVSITGGAPPYAGSYQPQQPLAIFVGKSGTNVNGTWQLRMVDSVGLDVGVLQCWSLFLSSAQCVDGGGSCPGADLAATLRAAPNPSFVGSNLVYTVTVTNFGPNAAKGVVVTHGLPSSVIFVSAVSSQGSCVFSGGSVICNLGNIPFEGTATITVTVLPTTVGVIFSSATVTSGEADPDLLNNTSSISTQVSPPTSELALGLLAAPNPALVGGQITYSLAVTNNGPSVASGVLISNTLPAGAIVQSASSSQGNTAVYGNVVVFNLGSLSNGARATASISVVPTAVGTFTTTSRVSANQADPISANNTRLAAVIVGPASDLTLAVASVPSSVVVGSNFTYTIGVTNLGPSVADTVVVNASIANGVTVLSTNTTLGTVERNGGTVTATLGPMNSGVGAVITILARATNVGAYPMSATVASASADPNPNNNSLGITTVVASPNVAITNAGGTLTLESLVPANGAIDNGETVTVTLRLRNAGNVNNTNLIATLLATNGVSSPSGAQNYGVLAPGGVPVGRSFTFTANGANGGVIRPTLQLLDGSSDLGRVAFTFTLSDVHAFSNSTPITINDALSSSNAAGATPYPSTIVVSGLTGLVGRVSVTLSNFNHTYPDDVDMLLVAPNGQKVMLMSDAGGGNAVANATMTFADSGAPLPDEGQLVSAVYTPADFDPGDVLPAPAPAGGYGVALSAFNGDSGNGTWSLYVVDDQPGDVGSIANGWQLAISTVTPVNQLADVRLTTSAAPNPGKVGSAVYYTFGITNAGPDTASGIAFNDVVPAGSTLLSAAASQGVVTTNASSVFVSLGNLGPGAAATVTVALVPTGPGSLTNTANVTASEIDLNPADNTASAAVAVVLPVADVGVAVAVEPSAVIGSNIVFAVVVTNRGPETALNVVVSDPLPAGLIFVSAGGGATNAGGTVIAGLGDLVSGGSASFNVVANAATLGAKTNTVTSSTGSSDPEAGDNSASAVVMVSAPSPLIVSAGATLLSESFTPANGTIEIGETVTVALSINNVGSADTTNLWGLLQPTGGVASPSAPKNYGKLLAGGPALTENYTFTAAGTNGGLVTASLLLDDEGPVTTLDYTFHLPATLSFANTNAISIPDHGAATPYPSQITVSGMTGLVSKVTVTLHGLTHGFPDDLDIMLVGPAGQKLVVMSDAGGGHALSNLNLTISDSAAALPDSGQISAGTYGPADYEPGDSFSPPAPAGNAGSALSALNGADANGDWSLFVVDDTTGDAGVIAGGWSLTITTLQTVSPTADLGLSMTSSPGAVYVGSALIYTLTVTNRGPSTASGVTVTDTLPAGLEYVSGSSSMGVVGAVGSVVSANLGDLAAGESALVTIRASASTSGTVVNSATASAAQLDLNLVNNTAQTSAVVVAPALARFEDISFTGGALQGTLVGEPGQTYVISVSSDFTNWTPVVTNTTAANGTFKFSDSSAPTAAARFYRAARVIP